MLKKFKLNIGQNWQMTLYAHLLIFVPNKIKIWNVMSIVLTQEVLKKAKTACIDYNNELNK
jgi:hypothetical protein